MSKSQTPSVTIEEAVARMVSLAYLPEGFTVQDITLAFLDDAETGYEDGMPGAKELHAIRANVCEARHMLTQSLITAIEFELARGADSSLATFDDAVGIKRITTESLSQWCCDQFGISAPEWEPWNQSPTNDDISWDEVSIKIYADYKLACFWGNGKKRMRSFLDLGLMGKRRLEPNQQGLILIGLSEGKKFPATRNLQNKDKAAISKLRNALVKLTGITTDPFLSFNVADGWKPRFKLIGDRRNADERAKARAQHVELDEARDFDDDDDDAGEWLAKNS